MGLSFTIVAGPRQRNHSQVRVPRDSWPHYTLSDSRLPSFTSYIVQSSLMLRPTVSRQVCLVIKQPSGAYDQNFITVRQLRVCWCGALSLTRGRVCRLQLLLALASAVILGSESRGTRDHILLSQIWDFSFCRQPVAEYWFVKQKGSESPVREVSRSWR
jgi:hypothetical protein